MFFDWNENSRQRARLTLGVPPLLTVVVFAIYLAATWADDAGYGEQLQINAEHDPTVEVVSEAGEVYHLEQWRPSPTPDHRVAYGIAVGMGVLIAGLGALMAFRVAGKGPPRTNYPAVVEVGRHDDDDEQGHWS